MEGVGAGAGGPGDGEGPGQGAGQGLGPQRDNPEPTPEPSAEAGPSQLAQEDVADADTTPAPAEVAEDDIELLSGSTEQKEQEATSPIQQPAVITAEPLAPIELPADGDNRQGLLVYQVPIERILDATDSAVLLKESTAEVQGGATLPEWLNYEGGSRTFTAVDPPEGALPLPVVVNVPVADGQVAVPVLLGQP